VNSGSALDNLRTEKRKMLAANRATWWALADLDAQAIAQHGAQVIDDLAGDEQCSRAHIKQRLALRSVFGEHRAELERVAFSVLRATANAAKRNGRDAWDLLQEALAAGWHVSNLDALGRTGRRRVEFKGHCDECDADVHYVFKKPTDAALVGLHVTCGFCAMTRTGAPFLGVLVAA